MKERGRADSRLEDLARSAADACGVEVVEVRFHSQGTRLFLRVDIDRPGPLGVDLADCEAVSRLLDRSMEEAGLPADRSYDLQVSSPGLDRPILNDDDFRRNTGRPIRIERRTEDLRVETLRGVLAGASPEEIVLEDRDGSRTRIERSAIVSATGDPGPDPAGAIPRRGRKRHGRRGIV